MRAPKCFRMVHLCCGDSPRNQAAYNLPNKPHPTHDPRSPLRGTGTSSNATCTNRRAETHAKDKRRPSCRQANLTGNSIFGSRSSCKHTLAPFPWRLQLGFPSGMPWRLLQLRPEPFRQVCSWLACANTQSGRRRLPIRLKKRCHLTLEGGVRDQMIPSIDQLCFARTSSASVSC